MESLSSEDSDELLKFIQENLRSAEHLTSNWFLQNLFFKAANVLYNKNKQALKSFEIEAYV